DNANADQADADGDGIGDACDTCPNDSNNDADGDGVCGDLDNCPDNANTDQADADGDGIGDACDTCPNDPDNDSDGDGVCGNIDNCPNNANADQADADGDGIGDACDACPNDETNTCNDCINEGGDTDGDGICDDVDNCLDAYNPDQLDSDLNGIGDVCDIEEPRCETGFAKSISNSERFSEDFNRWGWTNMITEENTYYMDIYIGAGDYQLSNENLVGQVIVKYLEGKVNVKYQVISGYSLNKVHLYIGCESYPKKGQKYTVAPGQYPFKSATLDATNEVIFDPIDVSQLNQFYIIAHAEVCEYDDDIIVTNHVELNQNKATVDCEVANKTSYRNAVKMYPNPVNTKLTIDINELVELESDLKIFDLYGRLLFNKKVENFEKVILEITKQYQEGVHLAIIKNNKQFIIKRFIVLKE
ncbi:thrombospondin type 3 repeat-containing protein, partial [Flavisericum labens]|uniref:thrombospondin type 3 repeat-containing protein n=1 Tax=Flavisericum labens TaxID=3377112 RepID=UPI00387B695A